MSVFRLRTLSDWSVVRMALALLKAEKEEWEGQVEDGMAPEDVRPSKQDLAFLSLKPSVRYLTAWVEVTLPSVDEGGKALIEEAIRLYGHGESEWLLEQLNQTWEIRA